jgi:hypothetical protein
MKRLLLILCLALATTAQAARPPTPLAAHDARRAADRSILSAPGHLRDQWCVPASEAALRSWVKSGGTGWLLEIEGTRYHQGHAMTWLEGPPEYAPGGWYIDPRQGSARGGGTILEWAPSPEVAIRRYRNRPGIPRAWSKPYPW